MITSDVSRHSHVLGFAVSHPWAIDRAMLPVLAGILARHVAGRPVDRAEVELAVVNRQTLPQSRTGAVAIVPVYGVIAPRMNLFSEMSGGTTFERLTAQLREAERDGEVSTIVLDIDSPGGNVAGMTEFAHELLRVRTKKPITAQVQFLGASAAYTIAACCTEVVAAPSARVGSVGVYTIHDDLSKAFADLGLARRYLFAGEGKVDGNETGPLSQAAEARIQALLDESYATMIGDIVKGRGQGVTAKRVRDDWKAQIYTAREGLAVGLIDTIATLDETLARLLSASPTASGARAAERVLPTATTPQEPATATGQESQSDASWQSGIEAALLALEI